MDATGFRADQNELNGLFHEIEKALLRTQSKTPAAAFTTSSMELVSSPVSIVIFTQSEYEEGCT